MADERRSTEERRKGYDSRPDTRSHIAQVQGRLMAVIANLLQRAKVHDASKLESPEVECFDEFTPKLKETTYGSEEYKGYLAAMQEGLAHHYAHNSHHPQHTDRGLNGMTLLDLVEMLADWKAATERHDDGDILRSVELNTVRFGISLQLRDILLNTIEELGWAT